MLTLEQRPAFGAAVDMFTSVLVPLDLAQPSSWERALPVAHDMAKANKASLSVVTVLPETKLLFEFVQLPFQLEEAVTRARGRLTAIIGATLPGVNVHQDVRVGSVAHEILEAGRGIGADLIVMQSHRPEMRDYLLGSNAAQVVRHARCAVLVLRRP